MKERVVPNITLLEHGAADYLCSIIGGELLRVMKGKLLNIVEGIGMPEKQETAVRRMVTTVLLDSQIKLIEVVNEVRVDLDQQYPPRILSFENDIIGD